jgi:hypothetical protein
MVRHLLRLLPSATPWLQGKKLSVREALSNGRWMRGLKNINSEEQLSQFVALWEILQQVNLQTENEDTIKWTLATDRKYSAKSAYDV